MLGIELNRGRGNDKEGLEVNSDEFLQCRGRGGRSKGDINSGPGGRGVLELVQTDRPGFSLCAAPLELSGPGFCGVGTEVR